MIDGVIFFGVMRVGPAMRPTKRSDISVVFAMVVGPGNER